VYHKDPNYDLWYVMVLLKIFFASIRNSGYLFLLVDLKMYRNVTNVEDCKLLQCDIHNIQIWFLGNCMNNVLVILQFFPLGLKLTTLTLIKIM
jgi:hypothetical protein